MLLLELARSSNAGGDPYKRHHPPQPTLHTCTPCQYHSRHHHYHHHFHHRHHIDNNHHNTQFSAEEDSNGFPIGTRWGSNQNGQNGLHTDIPYTIYHTIPHHTIYYTWFSMIMVMMIMVYHTIPCHTGIHPSLNHNHNYDYDGSRPVTIRHVGDDNAYNDEEWSNGKMVTRHHGTSGGFHITDSFLPILLQELSHGNNFSGAEENPCKNFKTDVFPDQNLHQTILLILYLFTNEIFNCCTNGYNMIP